MGLRRRDGLGGAGEAVWDRRWPTLLGRQRQRAPVQDAVVAVDQLSVGVPEWRPDLLSTGVTGGLEQLYRLRLFLFRGLFHRTDLP